MSLHIKLPIDKKNFEFKLNVAMNFFNFFKEEVRDPKYLIKSDGEIILKGDVLDKKIILNHINELENPCGISIDFPFFLVDESAYLEINSEYHSKFVGEVEINVHEENIINLFNNNHLREKFNRFLKHLVNENLLVKAYIDLNGEGEDNPLDIPYKYEPRGSNFFIQVIKALEILSEDSEDFLSLFYRVRGSDKNYVANRLWQNSKIRSLIFDIAKEKGIIAQEGSVLLYAKNDKQVKEYYVELINKILSPIFSKIPSIDREIKSFSEKLDS